MDELSAVQAARKLIRAVGGNSLPVLVEPYAKLLGAEIRMETELGPDEPGWAFSSNGKHYICVNAADRGERQRFTVCHELAHIALRLPSEHEKTPRWGYATKSQSEVICDTFAAELLLPYVRFAPLVKEGGTGLSAVDELAELFQASTAATGSRFAAVSHLPCAFVISHSGRIRYASRSAALRELNAWIQPRLALPKNSVAARLRGDGDFTGFGEFDADVWFSNGSPDCVVFEESRHSPEWDQTLSLLWFDEDEVLRPKSRRESWDEEESGLAELDGILRWRKRSRRK